MATDFKTFSEQDFQAWLKWKQSPTDENHSQLLHRFDPLISKEVNKWKSGTMPLSLMKVEAYKIVSEAMKNFNPSSGNKLSTYVLSQLQKLKRFGYRNQNILYIPESRTIKVKKYKDALDHLKETLGRQPSNRELADYLMWSEAEVARMEQELRSDLIAEQTAGQNKIVEVKPTDLKINFIYNDLSPKEQVVFEYMTGYGGKPELGVEGIAKKLKTSTSEIYRLREAIAKKIKNIL